MKLSGAQKLKPTLVGNPDVEIYALRMDEAVLAWGDYLLDIDQFDSLLLADASYFRKERVEGLAWQLTLNGKEYKLRSKGRRNAKGPTVAEMGAIVEGMNQAVKVGARQLVIHTDSRWSAHVLVGLWEAKQPHTVRVADLAMGLVEGFDTVAVVHTRTSNLRRVDRAARRAAEETRSKVREKEAAKRLEIERIMSEAESVRLRRQEDHWEAYGRFRVTVTPPSCTCGSWARKWRGVPLAGKRARRLPCKHIVAAAVKEGITDTGTLLAMSRKAKE